MRRRLLSILSVSTLLALGLALPFATAGIAAKGKTGSVRLSGAAQAWKDGLAANPVKAGKAMTSQRQARVTLGTAPTIIENFEGPHQPTLTPSDSVGAIGPTRFVNLVNAQYSIFDRATSPPTLLSTGSLGSFTPVEHTIAGLFDPQIMWDPQTQRFYYVMDVIDTDPINFPLAFGWSKTASPNSPSDWCHFSSDFGKYGTSRDFPDYPKMGDTQNFVLVGVNTFPNFGAFAGTDVVFYEKPGVGVDCPDTVNTGIAAEALSEDGNLLSTAVPAKQIDSSTTGYVVTSTDVSEFGASTVFQLWTATESGGGVTLSATPADVSVASYDLPAPAQQPGTSRTLDTLDSRFTNAVQAVDPRVGKTVVWTQHTTDGGAGARVRWYELDTTSPGTLVQQGTIQSAGLYVFNAAISPDRVNNGVTQAFGDSMIVGVTTSGSTSPVADQMVSKIGSGAQSGLVLVITSGSPYKDFSCDPVCRWGDYSAAAPDPASSLTADHGVIWLTNQYGVRGDPDIANWRVRNWSATP